MTRWLARRGEKGDGSLTRLQEKLSFSLSSLLPPLFSRSTTHSQFVGEGETMMKNSNRHSRFTGWFVSPVNVSFSIRLGCVSAPTIDFLLSFLCKLSSSTECGEFAEKPCAYLLFFNAIHYNVNVPHREAFLPQHLSGVRQEVWDLYEKKSNWCIFKSGCGFHTERIQFIPDLFCSQRWQQSSLLWALDDSIAWRRTILVHIRMLQMMTQLSLCAKKRQIDFTFLLY